MSHQLISRSPDLKRLRDEGYDVEIVADHLVIRDVPYVNGVGEIKRGTLVSTLRLAGDVTDQPDTHVAHFAGEYPSDVNGRPIAQIAHASGRADLGGGLVVDHSFSNRPSNGYRNYYEKMTRYIEIISAPAQAIDHKVSAQTHPVIECTEEESVFMYMDTASSRAEIGAVSDKLRIARLAILGTGGTGSYVLDLVAKTPVGEIHLYDGDVFSQHNAFRSPGAASATELREKPLKVDYLRRRYSNLHRHIVAHGYHATEENVRELEGMDFVFICMDKGTAKQGVVEKLEELGVPFVDVGMGLQLTDGALGGLLKITTSTEGKRDHFRKRVPFTDGGGNNEYDKNIQVADLNALNAALAVIKWKKLFGFYLDQEGEHYSLYAIGGNTLINEDAA